MKATLPERIVTQVGWAIREMKYCPLIRHFRWLWYAFWLYDDCRQAQKEGTVNPITPEEQEGLDAVWMGKK